MSDTPDQAELERSYSGLHPIDVTASTEILKEAKQILERFNVVFFLRQGTCLGTVREGGFIPWDDDMDLGSVIGLNGLSEESILNHLIGGKPDGVPDLSLFQILV